jgi:hypothetical protein
MAAKLDDVLGRFVQTMPMYDDSGHIIQMNSTKIDAVILFDLRKLEDDEVEHIEENFIPVEEDIELPKGAVLFGVLGFSGWHGGEWMEEFMTFGSLFLDIESGDGDDCPVLWYQKRDEDDGELDPSLLHSFGMASELDIKKGRLD